MLILFFLFLTSFIVPIHSTIVVMRHGESTHNVQSFFNSNPDHPDYRPSFLTQQGINDLITSCKQLLDAGFTKETVKVAYVSPLPRTIQTAAILVQMGVISHEALKIDKRLIEVQMGDRESKYYADFSQDPGDLSPENAALYHGESWHDIINRVALLLEEIKKNNQVGTTLLITHGGPAQALISLALGQEDRELPPAGFEIIK